MAMCRGWPFLHPASSDIIAHDRIAPHSAQGSVPDRSRNSTMATPIPVIPAAKATEKIVTDLYDAAKGGARTAIGRWRTKLRIEKLYRKIAKVRNVKTIWQLD